MQLDLLLINMGDFDYICPESITWVNDNIMGQGYTVTTVLERMNTDALIPEGERRVWIRNAKRMFDEPTAIVLGGDATVTDDYRVLVKEGNLTTCQTYIDTMAWVRFSTIDGSFYAETDMGDTYTDRGIVDTLTVVLERKTFDSVDNKTVWNAI